MKTNISKCIWTACITAALSVCITMTASAGKPSNLGDAYISSVTSGSNCVANTINGGSVQFWDIQVGGTYTVTLTGVTDCASQGNESQIGVIVHNSTGGNLYYAANYVSVGVYSFTIKSAEWTGQCKTMPIEYCTHDARGVPANLPGTGKFAQDTTANAPNGTAAGHIGHLRAATFGTGCSAPEPDALCQGGGGGCTGGATIHACKFFHFDPVAVLGTGESSLAGWPFCLTAVNDDGSYGSSQQQSTDSSGCATWSGLAAGEYLVSEADANDPSWFHNSDTSVIEVVHCTDEIPVPFGNYCTVPSHGLTLGFWSNKNGCKVLTGSTTGTTLYPDVVTLLNGLCLRNLGGSLQTFTNSYSDFKKWLLGATATNMAYMLSAQLATLELDVNFGVPPNKVDGGAFDVNCSGMTINELMNAAKNSLCSYGLTTTTSQYSAQRPLQEMYKNCIDKINNNADVVPSNSSQCASTTYTEPCPTPTPSP